MKKEEKKRRQKKVKRGMEGEGRLLKAWDQVWGVRREQVERDQQEGNARRGVKDLNKRKRMQLLH